MKRLIVFLAIAAGIGLATVTNAAQTPAKGQVAPAKPPLAQPPKPPAAVASVAVSAETVAPSRRQGLVQAAGVAWQCLGSRCTAQTSVKAPTVMLCRALAQQIGPVNSFLHASQPLTVIELQQCNAGIPSAPAISAAPLSPAPTVTAHAPLVTTGGRSGAVTINATDPLTMTGQRASVQVIAAGELIMTGIRPAPITVNTGNLEMTGQRSAPRTIEAGELVMTGTRSSPRVITAGELIFTGRRIEPVLITTPELAMTGLRPSPRTIETGELTMTGMGSAASKGKARDNR